MATGEFDLIGRYFTNEVVQRADVIKGIGDDCAILDVPDGKQLVVTTDTMVSGIHFLADAAAVDIAHKLVAVNMSDLAAMGAEPAWASLAITLPDNNSEFLAGFSRSLHKQLQGYGVTLIGGDTTKGPMAFTLTVQGFVNRGQALRRSGAKAGDRIFCSGSIGDAAAGLQLLLDKKKAEYPAIELQQAKSESLLTESEQNFLISRHQRPTARVNLGKQLANIASSCIDLSDGLSSDLVHVLKTSSLSSLIKTELAADIEVTQLPLSSALIKFGSKEQRLNYALAGGDDYELLFTVPEAHLAKLNNITKKVGISCTEIGIIREQVVEGPNRINYFHNQQPIELNLKGWDHFQ